MALAKKPPSVDLCSKTAFKSRNRVLLANPVHCKPLYARYSKKDTTEEISLIYLKPYKILIFKLGFLKDLALKG